MKENNSTLIPDQRRKPGEGIKDDNIYSARQKLGKPGDFLVSNSTELVGYMDGTTEKREPGEIFPGMKFMKTADGIMPDAFATYQPDIDGGFFHQGRQTPTFKRLDVEQTIGDREFTPWELDGIDENP